MKAEIWNYSGWIKQTNHHKLKEYYQKKLTEAGFDIVGYIEYKYYPQGFSCIWLIGESHFAIHTFPEEYKTYIELSSCNKVMYDKFILSEKMAINNRRDNPYYLIKAVEINERGT